MRKETVIQFGEGGFLRGFADYFFQKMQDKGLFDGSVVIVQPIEKGMGGTSMAGGSGKIGGTIIGGLIIGVLNNGLNLLNVNSFWQYVVKGTVILLAVFVDYLRNKKAE